MTSVVPHRFLFRYSLPVCFDAKLPKPGRKLLDLSAECVLPSVAELDDAVDFAELRAAWNTEGLGFSLTVTGKTTPLSCNAKTPTESDGLQLWLDTRDTQTIHRAGRFCHHFSILPAGGGAKRDRPLAIQLPIARAREDAPATDLKQLRMQTKVLKTGYQLDAWIPVSALHGFDPGANPRIGFYYCVRDAQLGDQFLSVGLDFPFSHDPSLWSTLELVR